MRLWAFGAVLCRAVGGKVRDGEVEWFAWRFRKIYGLHMSRELVVWT
jgi:hypothetical protein